MIMDMLIFIVQFMFELTLKINNLFKQQLVVVAEEEETDEQLLQRVFSTAQALESLAVPERTNVPLIEESIRKLEEEKNKPAPAPAPELSPEQKLELERKKLEDEVRGQAYAQAAEHYERHVGKPWLPRSGSKVMNV